MFAREPRLQSERRRTIVLTVLSCIIVACLIALLIPIFEMGKVTAGADEIEFIETEELTVEDPKMAFPSDLIVPEIVVPVTDNSLAKMEVTTEVVESQEEIEPETVIKEEPLESLVSDYDIPLDYDIDLAFQGMDYLVNVQGFSEAGAAGVMGNLYAECRFDSSCIDGYHKGLAQWDADCRWPMIARWLDENGYDRTSFEGQMNAIFYSDDAKEFTSGNPYNTFAKMRQVDDPREAALIWLYEYERAPGQAEGERQDIAELTYKLYTRTI